MNRYLVVSVLLVFLVALSSCKFNQGITDGPYVFIHDDESVLDVNWLCNGEVHSVSVNVSKLPYTFNQCNLNAHIEALDYPSSVVEYQGDYVVAAFSDVHGQHDLMIELLTNNNIIDENHDWRFGRGHVVIAGDVFDRGEHQTEALWFLYALEQQATKFGGKVHLLLGNHEVMNLNNKLRYVHKKYQAVSELLDVPYAELYSQQTVLGRWLRSKSVLVKVNNALFAHGGFHPYLAVEGYDLPYLNQSFMNSLVKSELSEPRSGLAEYVHGTKNGLIWYRGYFKDEQATSGEIDTLLTHFDVSHLVVGHTSQKQIETRYQGRVIAIDSSMKKGEYGEILFIDGDSKWRGTLSGKKLSMQ